MKRLSAKFHITLGITVMVISLHFAALFLGLAPDRHEAQLQGRAALAETITASSAELIAQDRIAGLEGVLRLMVERNDDVLSIAVRNNDGDSIVTVGAHDIYWRKMLDRLSTDSQIKVPIWSGDRAWGNVEMRFKPLGEPGILGYLNSERSRYVLFMAITGFIGFYLYLSRMLRHLDPSQAIPARVRSALDTMTQGLVVIDLKGYVVLVNKSFADICGQSPDALVGSKIDDLPWLSLEDARSDSDALPWASPDEGESGRGTGMVHFRGFDDRRRTLMVRCSPVMGADDKPRGVLIGLEDVTELEEKEIELRKSKLEAERANRAKSDFLANMSHEIRTPMNAILGFAELLKRGKGGAERDWKQHVNVIHSSGKHLLGLINDILDLSKVESGNMQIERIECQPHAIVRDVVRTLQVQAGEKDIALQMQVDGELPQTITSDPSRLRQIVTNLVGNAIKFTTQGGVRVVLGFDTGGATPCYSVSVIDTGVGMPKDKLDTIFAPFVQADSSVTRKFGGTGLGLTISKQFAKALGGDISVDSEPGKGSVFTLSIDPGPMQGIGFIGAETALEDDENIDPTAQIDWALPGMRILVADDGKQNRELLQIVLEDAGAEVALADNGAQALEQATQVEFDVILMDIQMPVMDGMTAVREIRREGLAVPVIALTAHAMEGFETEILESGFTSYATKPIDLDALIRRLQLMLSDRVAGGTVIDNRPAANMIENGGAPPANRELNEQSPTHKPAEPPFEEYDKSSVSTGPKTSASCDPMLEGLPIYSSLATRDPRIQRVVDEFVNQLPGQIQTLENALAESDQERLADVAHYLKGAAGTVGFAPFTKPAGALERLARAGGGDELVPLVVELRGLADRVQAGVVPSEADNMPGVSATDATSVKPVTAIERTPIFSSLPTRDPRIQAVVKAFVEELRFQIESLERGLAEQDGQTLADVAHYLKGAAGTVGFSQFTKPAAALEQCARAGDLAAARSIVETLGELAARISVEPESPKRPTAA